MLVETRRDPEPISLALERADDAAAPRLPLSRLIHLLMLLQTTRFPNARRLAETCGVSRRTIFRDLATLEAAGIRIAYRADRQGYQVTGSSMLQPTPLEAHEALALLLLGRSRTAADPFALPRLAASALAKLIQTLPQPLRNTLVSSSELLADDRLTSPFPKERLELHATILDAVGERRRMRVWSREVEPHDNLLTTKLGVYRLTRLRECWALVGHSSFHGGVRLFRIPWLEKLEITDEIYAIPPRFRLDRFLARRNAQGPDASLKQVVLRFSRSVAPAVRDAPLPPDRAFRSGPGGSIDIILAVGSLDDILDWIICYGDQVEVIEPEELRDRIQAWAEAIARIHARQGGRTSQSEALHHDCRLTFP